MKQRKQKVLIKDGLHDYLQKEQFENYKGNLVQKESSIKDVEVDAVVAVKDAFTSEYYCSVCTKDQTEESKLAALKCD